MWRKKVDKNLKPFLEKYIAETHHYRTNFEQADDKGKAQIWIAIALMSKQLYNLELKMDYLERALRDISASKESEKFLQEVEQKVKEKEQKGRVKTQSQESIQMPVIDLGHLKEDKIVKEKKALEEGAQLLSKIARAKKSSKKKQGKKKSKKKK